MDKKWEKVLQQYERHCQRIVKSTVVDIGESAAEKASRMSRLQKSYIPWFEYYFSHYAKKKSAKFHKQLADLIIKNKQVRLLAEIFRSGGKSVQIDMGIPLYLYLVLGELKFMLLIGETFPKSKKLLSDIQSELEYNQKIINDYGRKLKNGDWADGDFFTSDGVRFMSLGFGMSPRGLREGADRPDYISIDDVDTKRHVNNDKIMSDSVEYITEEIEGCFDTDSDTNACARMVYANNNFHKNSITNRLKREYVNNIAKDKDDGYISDYVVFTVAAVKSLSTFEPTWPEKTDAEYWRRKYGKNIRAFLRNYMHVHVAEGKIFKGEMMQWKRMLPLDEYEALVFKGDLSYKENGDFKAMWLVGKTKKEYHIIHGFLRQTSRQRVAKFLYDLFENAGLAGLNIKYEIDGLFAQDEFLKDFDLEGEERGYYIAVLANKKNNGDKFDFIESYLGVFTRLWVYWNIDEKDSVDQVECIDQFLAFEKGSQAHDDGPDAVCNAFKDLDKQTFEDKFEPRIHKRPLKSKRY